MCGLSFVRFRLPDHAQLVYFLFNQMPEKLKIKMESLVEAQRLVLLSQHEGNTTEVIPGGFGPSLPSDLED